MTRQALFSSTQSFLGQIIFRIWGHISLGRRRQLVGLLCLMILASLTEMISITVVLPFLGALTDPQKVFSAQALQPLINFFGILQPSELLLPLTIVLCLTAISSGGLRLLLLWAITKFSFALGADLSAEIYRRTLYQPYPVHISRSSSQVIDGISGKVGAIIYSAVLPTLNILTGVLVLVMILITLSLINASVAFGAFAIFGFLYFLIVKITKNSLEENGALIAKQSTQVLKTLQEGLGGIRDVLIDGNQEAFCKIYQLADRSLKKAQGSNLFISACPKYVIESLGIVMICILAFALTSDDGDASNAIPVLGAMALGAQRLLPVLQQIFSSWSYLKGGQAAIWDALILLDQPLPAALSLKQAEGSIKFSKEIALSKISFRYESDSSWVLKDVDLIIKKGSRVGFFGETGSGKSTLLDIIMGLLSPTTGQMLVDGIPITGENSAHWQSHIAHVPQAIFLTDSTVAENIAFGVPATEIDIERVKHAAQQAQISSVIEGWKLGYSTEVGERGVKLSGGQRQRIGIARAFYKYADVIVFDEATSALDSDTENLVINSIKSLSQELTLLVIAHRLSTLRDCDLIIKVDGSNIKRIGTYKEMIGSGVS